MDRIFVRFHSPQQKVDALQKVAFSHGPESAPKFLFSQPDVLHTSATDEMRAELAALGADIFEDVQFKVMPGQDGDDEYQYDDEFEPVRWSHAAQPDLADGYSLNDVIEQVRAPEAWRRTRGEGVTIAIVDTGIAGKLREFSSPRRSSVDLESTFEGDHWRDTHGHGSMCAAIAAASRADGGRFDGVAPGATVLAARSTLKSTDLADIFDELVRARVQGRLNGPLVVSNSYGLPICTAPKILPAQHPYMTSILAAINNGIFVCFAAGNNHHDVCKHDPIACGPNSIWGPNSHDEIVSVGTVNRELTNCDPATPHVSSSRGPGEWAVKTTKPDCVAPTYGEVVWGTSTRRMRWWGTSGACPQVAGAAALILSVAPGLAPWNVGEIIRETCSWLPEGKTCVGRGLLDCEGAVARAAELASTS
jgi:serine protease AprX